LEGRKVFHLLVVNALLSLISPIRYILCSIDYLKNEEKMCKLDRPNLNLEHEKEDPSKGVLNKEVL
jgi:hypothetical protein